MRRTRRFRRRERRAVILLDDEQVAAAFPSGLPHLVDADHRLAGVEGLPELVDDLAAARLEVVAQDRPCRLAKVVGVGVFGGAVDAPDDEVSVAADGLDHGGRAFTPARTIGSGSSRLAAVSAWSTSR